MFASAFITQGKACLAPQLHAVQMLVDLGQAVYHQDFEVHFLRASGEFYKVSAPALAK
jgi:hypothetical protein